MQDIRIAAAICRCPVGDVRRNLDTVGRLTRRAADRGGAPGLFSGTQRDGLRGRQTAAGGGPGRRRAGSGRT